MILKSNKIIHKPKISHENSICLLNNPKIREIIPIENINILMKKKTIIKPKNRIINNESFNISKIKKQSLKIIKNDNFNIKESFIKWHKLKINTQNSIKILKTSQPKKISISKTSFLYLIKKPKSPLTKNKTEYFSLNSQKHLKKTLIITKNTNIIIKNSKNNQWNNLIEQGFCGVDLLALPKESRRMTLDIADYFIDTNRFEIKANKPFINFENNPRLTPIQKNNENNSFVDDYTKQIFNNNYISNENNFTVSRKISFNKNDENEMQKNVSFAIVNEDLQNTVDFNHSSKIRKHRVVVATIAKVEENKYDSFDENLDPLDGIKKHKKITKYDKYFDSRMKKSEIKFKNPANIVSILNKQPKTKKIEYVRDFGTPGENYLY